MVTASNTEHTISAYTNAQGIFVLHGVPQGTYTITIEPELTSGFEILILENVVVTNGEIAALGNITLL